MDYQEIIAEIIETEEGLADSYQNMIDKNKEQIKYNEEHLNKCKLKIKILKDYYWRKDHETSKINN